MVKTLKELKDFILWCKEQKIKSFSIDGVQVDLHELALVEDLPNITPPTSQPTDSKLLVETEPEK